jgi:hypothetical protein
MGKSCPRYSAHCSTNSELPSANRKAVVSRLSRPLASVWAKSLEQLAGRLQVDGQHDQITSITRYGEETWRLFMEFLDEAAGIVPGAREAQAAVDKADTGDSITLSPEQAHDVQLFRLASDRAAGRGIELRIVGPEGEGSITPTPGPNGAVGGGQGGA